MSENKTADDGRAELERMGDEHPEFMRRAICEQWRALERAVDAQWGKVARLRDDAQPAV